MLEKEALVLLGYLIAIMLFLCAFIAVFVMFFLKRKNLLVLQKMQEQQKFEKELAKTEIEIKENTLKNIGWELHDNVGQLLSVVNIHLNMLEQKSSGEQTSQIKETKEVVSHALQEVRSLSKTLNNDVILKNGLVTSIQTEVERFNRLKFLEASILVEGEEKRLNSSDEIIIFRIVQEFLSNVIKHAKATSLQVFVTFSETTLTIVMQDNGVGFSTKTKSTNSGTETMRSRAEMIGATFELNSEIGQGTTLKLSYTF
ncbi:histidine kinase [Rasiella rasia]|uniref:histidine kinase n=1 Tax=Rasiella rasia TaxID=2744027 RepID=A0A6G6GI76_9FLAO|nr:histidine kinase [Rasiella rasia]QIE58224.1 histidine kinase [Rasiella rasia]